jgi:hypothetical protein
MHTFTQPQSHNEERRDQIDVRVSGVVANGVDGTYQHEDGQKSAKDSIFIPAEVQADQSQK